MRRKHQSVATMLAVVASLAGTATASAPARAASPVTPPAILCPVRVDNPHASTTTPGLLIAKAQVTCTSKVAAISTTVSLYLDGFPVANNQNRNTGQASLFTQVETTCVDGDWEAVANTTVTLPPGYIGNPSGSGSSAATVTNCP
jgi:hypothetical protein